VLERALVIKVLHAHLARDAEMRERFRREAESASQLVHPHICTIIDYAEAAEAVFIVMPYLAGGSLADVLVKERTVSAGPAAAVCAQIATALDYAHRRGVVHRDVKPDNVLFDEDGHALITDFGIATARFPRPPNGDRPGDGDTALHVARAGDGEDGRRRSDIYAVGVMLYEMLLGFPPFDGADSYSVGYKHVHETAAAPDVVDSRVSPELSALVMRCLSKAADARFQTGAELADALLAFLIAMGSAAETRSHGSRAAAPVRRQRRCERRMRIEHEIITVRTRTPLSSRAAARANGGSSGSASSTTTVRKGGAKQLRAASTARRPRP
jgi:serine/threonine-protein kinase